MNSTCNGIGTEREREREPDRMWFFRRFMINTLQHLRSHFNTAIFSRKGSGISSLLVYIKNVFYDLKWYSKCQQSKKKNNKSCIVTDNSSIVQKNTPEYTHKNSTHLLVWFVQPVSGFWYSLDKQIIYQVGE